MEEFHVTVDSETYPLPRPFMLFATQNPIEFEGTYTLPEAQLDRFLLKISLGYPDAASEKRLVLQPAASRSADALKPVATVDDVIRMRELAAEVHMDDGVADYLLALIRESRAHPAVLLGASPRAAVALSAAVRARALLHNRSYVIPDDVKALAPLVLGHRMHLRPEARMNGLTPHVVLDELMRRLPVPVGSER
jgi:MoxR-like ATPase